MNPNGLIPVFKDKKIVLWESNAIVRYIGANHGRRRLIPSNPAPAIADQWMDYSSMHVLPALTDVFMKTVRTAPKMQDREAIDAAGDKLGSMLSVLDAQLADKEFVTGKRFSVADIAVASNLYRYYAMDFERPNHKNLRGYFDRMLDRPAFARTIVTSFEPLRVNDSDVPDSVAAPVMSKAVANINMDDAKEKASQAMSAATEKASAALASARGWFSKIAADRSAN